VKPSKYSIKLYDFKKSFGFRIFIAFITVVFMSLSVFSLLHIYLESRTAKENLIKKGKIVAGFLANSSKTAVFAENKEALANIAEGVINEEEILSLSIYSQNWDVLYETQEKFSSDNLADSYRDLSAQLPNSKTFKTIEKPEVIECLTPIVIDAFPNPAESLYFETNNKSPKERIIGYVRVGLDKKILTREIKAIFLRVLMLALIISLSGTVIIYVAARRVSMPLTKLTESVRMFGIEGAVKKIEFTSDDEFGKLASAFNKMAEDLSKREEEKKALEDQLINAKKMEAVGTLSRGIAHDFNNILATIKGASFILKKKLGEDSPMQQYIQKVNTSLERADNLIQSLLAFSKGQGIDPQPVNINTLIKKWVPFCVNCSDSLIQCTFSLSDKDLIVMADQTQIEQILLNLITNARQAMFQGGLLAIATDTLLIGPHNEKDYPSLMSGQYVAISVADTGTGIREELLDRIFEPFFTTKETGKGTGLGLSIAYGIINQYHGLIDVSTQTGVGSIFTVYLPRYEAEKK
jgi:signal transduction histidine kinase